MILALSIPLLTSACTGTVVNTPDPTPTTVMGVIAPAGTPTDVATQIPTQVPTLVPTEASTDSGALLDICSLATTPEVETVLGQSVTSITPGTDSENIPGATINFCTYLGKGLAVVVSSVDAGSAQAAGAMMQTELANMKADDASVTSKVETGLGDQAYWSVAEHAVSYTVVKGARVFSVLIGGSIGDAASYKAPLLILAKSVSSKL